MRLSKNVDPIEICLTENVKIEAQEILSPVAYGCPYGAKFNCKIIKVRMLTTFAIVLSRLGSEKSFNSIILVALEILERICDLFSVTIQQR